jgi:hypothetical protein
MPAPPLLRLMPFIFTVGVSALDMRTKSEIKAQLLASYDASVRPNLASALEASRRGDDGCAHAPPDDIEAQIYIDFLTVDQKLLQYTIEGFLRVWWDDPRLAFNGTSRSSQTAELGCLDRLIFRDANDLWLPDLYFENVVDLDIGGSFSSRLSESLTVYPNGSVWWSRQLRVTLRCRMLFGNLPFDTQECPIKLGLYADTVEDSRLRWRGSELLLDAWEAASTSTWIVSKFSQHALPGEYKSLRFDRIVGVLYLQRESSAYLMLYVAGSIILVIMAYAGMWINPAAVPARVGLGAISVLVINNLTSSAKAQLPPFSYRTWLTDFMFASLVFNLIAFLEYAAVNFGASIDLKLRAAERESRSGHGKIVNSSMSNANGRSTPPHDAGVRLVSQRRAVSGWARVQARILESVRHLKDLDHTFRWLFALTYLLYVTVMFSIGENYNEEYS